MRQEEADGNAAASQPRCEIAKTILEEECERPGESRYRGMLLCGPHAALLGVEDRAEELLGTMFGRIRHQREEVVAALRLTRTQLRSARKVVSVGS